LRHFVYFLVKSTRHVKKNDHYHQIWRHN
jgi:hypothetical protein